MGFTGTAIPDDGIGVVALDPMQIGVHPRASFIIDHQRLAVFLADGGFYGGVLRRSPAATR